MSYNSLFLQYILGEQNNLLTEIKFAALLGQNRS